MEMRTLGRSGLEVSVVGLGCNNFGARIDLEASRAVVHKALDLGITLLDTADMYGNGGGSETVLGKVLGPRRKDVILATKFGWEMDTEGKKRGASRRYMMQAVEDSLRRLNTDWIDLYQLHKPDPKTPIEETLRTLDDLVRQGKVRYIGCSNLSGWQVATAQWTSRDLGLESFISAQDEYSLLVREHEKELIPALRHYGLGLIPYFPLACGLLTGKYRRGSAMPEGSRLAAWQRFADKYLTERNWIATEGLEQFAAERGHSMTELAFSWLAARSPVTSVIAGATKPEQVEANARAVSWKLTGEDLAEIDRITAIA
jgi:aryl-alcohol dehydrogenase-like predicted oxidoreductase